MKLNELIQNARTIQEKSIGYSKDLEIDNSYFEEWRDVRTLLTDKYFDIMLKEMGMSKEEFSYTLQPNSGLEISDNDEWYYDFKEIIDSYDYNKINYDVGVNIVALPFSNYIARTLKKEKKEISNIKISEEVIDSFIREHVIEMFRVMGKITAVKLEEYKLTHEFVSEDNEERFKEFLRGVFVSKESFEKLFEEYPVAARVATVRTMYLKKNFCSILKNIEKDCEEIKEFLNVDSLNLTAIKLSTGDSHQQGNAVSILSFEDKKLVYKPKNLKICESFNKLIDWYTSRSDLLDIKIPEGIYKETYTYNEYIEQTFCENEHEVEKFYIRYGYLIALCYLLNINDLHLENVIAHGEYPIIIDIETSFQISTKLEKDTVYTDLIHILEVDSVSNSFLLPKQLSAGNFEDVELSALNGRKVELSEKLLAPKEINTDKFHYEKVPAFFQGGNNIPKFNEDTEVEFEKYSLRILEGFDDFMSFIMKNKEEFLNVLNVFRGQKIRVLTKSTEKYASMIRFADHPNYNREMKYRERLMMNVWAFPYKDKRIIKSEVNDLLFDDIPIFYSYTDSKDLIDSHGNIYSNYFNKLSGFDLCIKNIKALDKKEIQRQKYMIIAALGISDCHLNKEVIHEKLKFNIQKFDYLKQAKKIAEKLISEAYIRDDKCTFMNVDCDKRKKWRIIPADESLYGGLSGISIFFLELYMRTKEEKYLKYYKMLIKTAIEQTEYTGFESAFTKWLSPVYPLILEYKYLNTISDKKFLEFTIKKLKSLKIEDMRKASNRGDFIAGTSGIICLLSLIYNTFGKELISENIIDKFSQILLEKIKDGQDNGMEKAGIAHGISGIMLGLSSCGKLKPEVIKKYLLKESKIEIPEKDVYKWCWGLPGMIQSRIQLLKDNSLNVDKEELDILIEKFEKSISLMVDEDCLCHGNGSIVVTLKMIYEYTKQEKWMTLVNLWMSNITMNSFFGSYKISKLDDVETKGIFDGISGIGWLYLYTSSSINNILLLEAR